jgi:hypothetical protein
MAGANRLPDSLYVDMLSDDSYYGTCQGLFEDATLQKRLALIPTEEVDRRLAAFGHRPDTEPRRRMLAAVLGVSWGYCHRVNESPQSVIHAKFLRETTSIVLYSTSCDAKSIYRQRITSLDLGHRFFLVTAHELGHAIDLATDRLPPNRDTAAENRATWYGTFIAQCASKLWQGILVDNSTLDRTDSQRALRSRVLSEWKAHDKDIEALRQELHSYAADLGQQSTIAPSVMSPFSTELAGIFSCESPKRHR